VPANPAPPLRNPPVDAGLAPPGKPPEPVVPPKPAPAGLAPKPKDEPDYPLPAPAPKEPNVPPPPMFEPKATFGLLSAYATFWRLPSFPAPNGPYDGA